MCITICKIDDQCKFDAWRALKAGALGKPIGMGWEGGPGWGKTWTLLADSCQCMAKNHHNIVK